MRCVNCGTEIPEASRFCLSCGEEVPGAVQPRKDKDSEFNLPSMMLFALAFMMFFFSMVPMFLGYMEGMLLMDGVGVGIVVVALINLWLSRRHEEREAERREMAAERMEKARAEAMAKLKCRYCGALNDRSAMRCEACGATL
jgi:predicted nucleic acid-binding Zn ribbon protein